MLTNVDVGIDGLELSPHYLCRCPSPFPLARHSRVWRMGEYTGNHRNRLGETLVLRGLQTARSGTLCPTRGRPHLWSS